MSGSIGGSRIKRNEVMPTFQNYIIEVLAGFPGFTTATITGSYNAGVKKDHGDIDLVVYIKGDNLKQIKKDFKSYLDSLELPEFRWGRNHGQKTQMYGSIVTCGFPIEGRTDDYVQIDNIIVNSESSFDFQKHFLDMDAAKQALAMGLVKIIYPYSLDKMKRLGLGDINFELYNNQEYEFTLSQKGISLRLVTLSDERKELSHKEIWRSDNWNDLLYILKGIDLSLSYEQILDQANGLLKDERNKKRVIGVMKSIIHVGPGEIGTPKGEGKLNAIHYIEEKLK